MGKKGLVGGVQYMNLLRSCFIIEQVALDCWKVVFLSGQMCEGKTVSIGVSLYKLSW